MLGHFETHILRDMGRRALLYVEDDEATFFLLALALKEADASIDLYRAADGEEALAFLQHPEDFRDAPRPDLILLDLNLPKKGGIEVLSEVKADPALKSIPVVMFSSSDRADDKVQSLGLGAKEYVTKPRSLDNFLEVVKRVCLGES